MAATTASFSMGLKVHVLYTMSPPTYIHAQVCAMLALEGFAWSSTCSIA